MRGLRNRRWFWIGAGAGVLLLAGLGVWWWVYWGSLDARRQMQRVVREVGRLIVLPEGEEPTLATVTDGEQVSKQPFFAKAQKGDKVLLYPVAKMAFLYRPAWRKLVNVGPISGEISYQKFTVAVRNGSGSKETVGAFESALRASFPNVVASKTIASRSDFPNTIVIPVKDEGYALARLVADSLHLQLGVLPNGEAMPDGAEVLIVVGRDYEAAK